MGRKDKIKIIIAALTYQREKGLETLLSEVEKLNVPSNFAIDVLIVDNSPLHTAKNQLHAHLHQSRFEFHIVSVPERGIAHARNQVLQFAVKSDAEYLLMIDDDEYPSQDWVIEMLHAFEKFDGHVMIGPVHPVFEKEPKQWMINGKYFSIDGYQDGEILTGGNTSNVAVKLSFLRTHAILFNRKFDFTGGEDTYFFSELLNSGAQIMFAQRALVYETIVKSRSTISWLIKRWTRTGNTDAYIRLLHSQSHIRIFLEGISRTIIGILLMIIAIVPLIFGQPDNFFKCLRITSRGIGYLSAALRLQHNEYKDVTR